MSEFRLACPACNGPLVVRCSKGESPCVRSVWYQCKNLACGATFGGSQTIDYQLSPSGLTEPLLVLPLAPSRLKRAATQASRMTGGQRERLKDQASDCQRASREDGVSVAAEPGKHNAMSTASIRTKP